MDVFLVPLGDSRHELYCEAPIEPLSAPPEQARPPWWGRPTARFRQLVAQAEEEHRRRERGQPTETRGLWRWIMRKIAETVGEQRLLWLLQRRTSATLVHPDDLSP